MYEAESKAFHKGLFDMQLRWIVSCVLTTQIVLSFDISLSIMVAGACSKTIPVELRSH
jgi:hypothetical protein